MQIFVGFQFENGQPSPSGYGEQVKHGSVGGREGRNLLVNDFAGEGIIDLGEIAGQGRLQPGFGLQAKERVAHMALGRAAGEQTLHQIDKYCFGLRLQRCFIGSGAEGHVRPTSEGVTDESLGHAGEFKSV